MKRSVELLLEKLTEKKKEDSWVDTENLTASLKIVNGAPYYTLFLDEEGSTYVQLCCFWRSIVDSRIVFVITDDPLGQGQALNTPEALMECFPSKKVIGFRIKYPIRDLHIVFEGGDYIEALASSRAYESWAMGGNGATIICLGGGDWEGYCLKPKNP